MKQRLNKKNVKKTPDTVWLQMSLRYWGNGFKMYLHFTSTLIAHIKLKLVNTTLVLL